MRREYLEEDLRLIRKYFPGARAVALRTPFDLTPKGRPVLADTFRELPTDDHWYGDLLWKR